MSRAAISSVITDTEETKLGASARGGSVAEGPVGTLVVAGATVVVGTSVDGAAVVACAVVAEAAIVDATGDVEVGPGAAESVTPAAVVVLTGLAVDVVPESEAEVGAVANVELVSASSAPSASAADGADSPHAPSTAAVDSVRPKSSTLGRARFSMVDRTGSR